MTHFSNDPVKCLGHDQMRAMTQLKISVMTQAWVSDPSQ
jgi:hypothetical protein